MTISLFDWQRAMIAAPLPEKVRMTALRVALDSTAATGRDVVINEASVAGDLRCSERTVWRHVKQLVELGWMAQTVRPAYVGAGSERRRARYRLLLPGVVESSDTATADGVTRPAESSDTQGGGVSHDRPESSDTSTLAVSHDTAETSDTTTADGVTRPAESSDTPPPGVARFPPVTTNAAAAARAIPRPKPTAASGPVSILASKLRLADPRLRGLRDDGLDQARTTQLEDLIDLHGDQALVDVAIRGLREPIPTFVQAFLRSWASMPPPGRRLAIVPEEPCPTHGRPGTVRHCIGCAADQKAGGTR